MSSWLDKLIEAFSPAWGIRRQQARLALKELREPTPPLRRSEVGWKPVDPGKPLADQLGFGRGGRPWI